ncbi:MAG: leucine-rich repeat protein [Lachnospiraceae bacterium]|nr:leucine-rich repeat protein [Lachnospiraceae bacterium]
MRMQKRRLLKQLFFISAMVLLVLPLSSILVKAESTAIVASGECGAEGSNVTWVLTENGTINGSTAYKLTISGTGTLADYINTGKNAPWFDYRTSINEAVINNGVTNTGVGVFRDCKNLNNVSLPNSLQVIGRNTFSGCSSLVIDTIPSSVTVISSCAFTSCKKITSITLPDNLSTIDFGAFSYTSLTTIYIPANVSYIRGDAFTGCTLLESIIVSEDNEKYCSVDGVLFDKSKTTLLRCPASLTSYVIPDTVNNISKEAFTYSKIKEIVIPEGVTKIYDQTFENCKNLETVTLPYTLKGFGSFVFNQCSSLKKIIYKGNESRWNNVDKGAGNTILTSGNIEIEFYILYDVTVINGMASPSSGIEGAEITINAKTIEGKVFKKWTSEDGVVFDDSEASTTTFTLPGKNVQVTAEYVDLYKITVENGSSKTLFALPGESVEIAADQKEGFSFEKWTSEDVITFDNDKSSETTFVMPEKNVTIKANYKEDPSFWYCGGEGDGSNATWSVSKNGQKIELYGVLYDAYTLTISGTGTMSDYDSPGKSIEYGYFSNCVTEINVSRGITRIGDYSFALLEKIKKVSVSDSVIEIGAGAFENLNFLEEVSLGSGIKIIEEGAFSDCDIKYIELPEGVEEIESGAFRGNDNLITIDIGKNSNGIKFAEAFEDCFGLQNINVDYDNQGYTVKDGVLFSKDMTKLLFCPEGKVDKTYVIPSEVTEICDCAFVGNSFKSIIIPGNVKTIGEDAFKNSQECESMFISEGVEEIKNGAIGLRKKATISVPESVKKMGYNVIGNLGSEVIDIYMRSKNLSEQSLVYAHGNLYVPVYINCDMLKNDGLTIKYICTPPSPEKNTFDYSGSEITFIESISDCGYTVTNNKKTDVGSYKATVSLKPDCVIKERNGISGDKFIKTYVWGDVTKPETWPDAKDTADKTYEWSIVAPSTGSQVTASAEQTSVAKDKGTTVTAKEVNAEVKVTSNADEKPAVTFNKTTDKKATNVVVADNVTVDNVTYEMTAVSANAFKGSKATSVTLGKNISKLSPKAFNGSKVATIVVRTKKLTKKSVKNAFKGCKVKKVIVKVKVGSKAENKKYVKKYKKIFTKKNVGVKIIVK